MLGGGLIGYLAAPTTAWQQRALLAEAVLLIFPGVAGDLLGAAGFATGLIVERRRGIRAAA